MTPVKAQDKKHLKLLIQEHMDAYGNECDLNHINVSGVNNISDLFFGSSFNGDISQWDVSNVEQISHIFQDSGFEGCLREWNLHPQVEVVRPFSKFHDSVLGYVGVFNGEYEVPENHPQHHRLNESPAHSAEH